MSWNDGVWQRWQPEQPWAEPAKGKGKGKGYGKAPRQPLSSALETVQSAMAEQHALAALAAALPTRTGEEWPIWAPGAGPNHFMQHTPTPWQHPQCPAVDPQAPRHENTHLGQTVLSSLAANLAHADAQVGTLALGAVAAAVRTAVRGRSPNPGAN